MLRNYLKIALRNIRKFKGYMFINIFGFVVGITCTILIALFIIDELSYDKFYPNSERIFRVANYSVVNNRIDNTARSSPPLAKVLAEEFPEVEFVTKCRNYGAPVFRYKEKVFSEERVFNVDRTFFTVFQIPFLHGNPRTALDRPDAIVLTKSMAMKYFGNEDPMGKTINADNKRDYIVTAVVEDVPQNSHFHFDFLRSLANYSDAQSLVWVFNDFYSYVLLKPNTDIQDLEAKLFGVVKERIDPFLRNVLGISVDQFLESGGEFKYYFQPLTAIHLYSNLDFEIEPNSDIRYVYIFLSIAIGVLLIACINFINLATARSTVRVKEIGIRKTIGSTQKQIMVQFLTETIVITIISVIFSWILAYYTLPLFNQITGKNFDLAWSGMWWIIPFSVILAVVLGLISGLYPAFIMGNFNPSRILKGNKFFGSQKLKLRTILVIFQFGISTILIIATLTVREQLQYIQTKDLGFNKDQIVVIHKTDDLGKNLFAFKNELVKNHLVQFASNSVDLLGNNIEVVALTPEGQAEDQTKIICFMQVDDGFLDTYKIPLNEGTFFTQDRLVNNYQVVLNESAVKAMGLTDPIGIRLVNSMFPENRYSIIGVVKDFHFQSLKQRIQPMVFASLPQNSIGRFLSVRISPEEIDETLKYIEKTWLKFSNGQALEYEFFDNQFARIYLAEKNTEYLFFIFSILSIIVACFGLFGLSSFVAERRTKEVGIRKILGSSTTSVVMLLIWQFLKWVVIANIIAWPIAWYVMNSWLGDFAYRINLEWSVFLIAGIIAVIITLFTVSSQAIKAAIANPVESLRYE